MGLVNRYRVYLDNPNQDDHNIEADGYSIDGDLVLSFYKSVLKENGYNTTDTVAAFKGQNWAWFQKLES